MSIRVMLADDQTLVRQGICSLLELSQKIEVVGQVNDGSEVLDGIRQCWPDVLLLDIRMPKMNGIDALRAMRAADLTVPCIILTTFDDHQLVLEGLQAGARGYLLKDVSLESLVSAIEAVYGGNTLVQPAVTERVLRGLATMAQETDSVGEVETLSKKELEVLRMMAGGYSNKEISIAIFKSEGTVKNQVSSVLAKLGVRDRTQAVLRAINLGLLAKASDSHHRQQKQPGHTEYPVQPAHARPLQIVQLLELVDPARIVTRLTQAERIPVQRDAHTGGRDHRTLLIPQHLPVTLRLEGYGISHQL